MAFLWFGGFKPPLPPQLWRCSWPRCEGRAGVSGEQRRDGVWPRSSKHTHTHAHTHTTFGFVHLGAGGVQLTHCQSALLLSSQSLRAQIRCYRSAGLSSPCDCFWGGVKTWTAMSVLKGPVDPYYIKKHIFSLDSSGILPDSFGYLPRLSHPMLFLPPFEYDGGEWNLDCGSKSIGERN